jgi:hypothetical protein
VARRRRKKERKRKRKRKKERERESEKEKKKKRDVSLEFVEMRSIIVHAERIRAASSAELRHAQ